MERALSGNRGIGKDDSLKYRSIGRRCPDFASIEHPSYSLFENPRRLGGCQATFV